MLRFYSLNHGWESMLVQRRTWNTFKNPYYDCRQGQSHWLFAKWESPPVCVLLRIWLFPWCLCSLFPRERLAARGEFELAIFLSRERGCALTRSLQKFATAVTLHLFVRAHMTGSPLEREQFNQRAFAFRQTFVQASGPLFFVADQDFSLLTCHLQTKYT